MKSKEKIWRFEYNEDKYTIRRGKLEFNSWERWSSEDLSPADPFKCVPYSRFNRVSSVSIEDSS